MRQMLFWIFLWIPWYCSDGVPRGVRSASKFVGQQ